MAQDRPIDHEAAVRDAARPCTEPWSGHESEPTKAAEVTIYVSKHCFNCVYALEIAAAIRREFPHVKLIVIDVTESHAALPIQVFATPTYLLNGKTWFLGNPSPEQVRMKLSQGELAL
jgi:hypothetical protein